MRFTILELGDARVFTYGKFKNGKSHILPSLSGVDVVADDPPHPVTHRWYQLAWFGLTLNLDVPTRKNRRGFFMEFSGVIQWLTRLLS